MDFPDACFSHTLNQSGMYCCAYLNHSLEKPGIGWLTVAVKSTGGLYTSGIRGVAAGYLLTFSHLIVTEKMKGYSYT